MREMCILKATSSGIKNIEGSDNPFKVVDNLFVHKQVFSKTLLSSLLLHDRIGDNSNSERGEVIFAFKCKNLIL